MIKNILKQTFFSGTQIYIFFVKIMIPTLIFVRILGDLGGIDYLAKALTPVMEFLNLGGESALVWASAILVNLYAGLSIFSNMESLQNLTVAQATTISLLVLIVHNIFMEMAVVRMVGLKLPFITLFRFISTVFIAFLFIKTANNMGFYQESAKIIIEPQSINSSFELWAINSLKSLIFLLFVIYLIVFIVEILKAIKITDLLESTLSPIFRLAGISKEASNITVIGLLLGLAYGGAFFIEEIKNNKLKDRDIYLSISLLCLSHAIIEDTLLMILIGADMFILVVYRFFITLFIIWLLSLVVNNCSDRFFYKYFFHKKIK